MSRHCIAKFCNRRRPIAANDTRLCPPRLNDTPYSASRDYTRERRMRSLAVEVTGTEERAAKRAAVPELEASSSSSSIVVPRPSSLLDRESNMPALIRACTTATLPRIKRFKFASIGKSRARLISALSPPVPFSRALRALHSPCTPIYIRDKTYQPTRDDVLCLHEKDSVCTDNCHSVWRCFASEQRTIPWKSMSRKGYIELFRWYRMILRR